MGNRTDVRWVTLTNAQGIGLLAVGNPLMEINALHATPRALENVHHPDEVAITRDVILRVNYRQTGVGGDNSWNASGMPYEKYCIKPEGTYRFVFRLKPILTANSSMKVGKQGFNNLMR